MNFGCTRRSFLPALAGLAVPLDGEGRIVLVHLKDLGADGSTVEAGSGVLAMEQIVRTAVLAGVRPRSRF